MTETGTGVRLLTDIAVIGAGQAGLSAAWHLKRLGLKPGRGFVVLDSESAPGGAWLHRWPSLTLSTVNRIHDLPGLEFSSVLEPGASEVRASEAVPRYFAEYEARFGLQVWRPVRVLEVRGAAGRLEVVTDRGELRARGVINATGTWQNPHLPRYPGTELFRGLQLHTRDYRSPEAFRGQHVVVVGAGISAIQLLDEISQVATTTWVSRRPPDFREGPFDEGAGRRAVALVDERVRQGLPPQSVVSVTGLPVTPRIEAMRARGVLKRREMFTEIMPDGVRFADGSTLQADVIIWNTGFRGNLAHLAPLQLHNGSGGITMTGRLATQVAADPRIHLVGYGPSSSTIGANRAGGAAARELVSYLRDD